jgi:hypothetical protein
LQYSTHFAKQGFQTEDLLKIISFHFSLELEGRSNKEDLSPFVNKIELLSKELEECIQSY